LSSRERFILFNAFLSLFWYNWLWHNVVRCFSLMKFSWSDMFGQIQPSLIFKLQQDPKQGDFNFIGKYCLHDMYWRKGVSRKGNWIPSWYDIDLNCPSIWILKGMPRSVIVWRCCLKRNLDPTML
jgi:hypothetical protein